MVFITTTKREFHETSNNVQGPTDYISFFPFFAKISRNFEGKLNFY